MAHSSAPELFIYAELEEFYDKDILCSPLKNKLNHLLTTPFVETSTDNSKTISFSRLPKLGEFLRVAHWNIQRGLKFEAIEALFESLLDNEDFPGAAKKDMRF